MADIDTSFMKPVLNLPQRRRKSDIHHHREADNLRRAIEITEGMAHRRRLRNLARRLKPVYSDNAVDGVLTRHCWNEVCDEAITA